MAATLADIRGLSVTYPSRKGTVTAVDAVDISIEEGSIFGIAGESGCGKTTIGLSLLGMIREPGHVEGRVAVNGRDVTSIALARLSFAGGFVCTRFTVTVPLSPKAAPTCRK